MLTSLNIEPRLKSPKVTCNHITGEIYLSGRSIMENPFEFYEVLNQWIKNFIANSSEGLFITIKLEYLNSGSKRSLFPILKQLQTHNSLEILWHYPEDDLDIKEIGEDFKADLNLPIQLISTNPDEF